MEQLLKIYSKIPNIRGKNFLGNKLVNLWQPHETKQQHMKYDFDLLLDLNDRIQRQMYIKRVYEESTVKNLIPFFKKSSVFFDVGANIGYFSFLASKINKDLKIYSFEPLPKNRESIKKNIKLNDSQNIQLVETCLSDTDGETQFAVPPNNEGGWGRISKGKIFGGEIINIKTQTLDSFCQNNNIRKVDFIKMDVEGYELHVLQGARGLLSSPKAPSICLEINEACLTENGVTSPDIFSYLKKIGYSLFYIDKSQKLRLTDEPLTNYNCWNYFAIKK